MRGNAPQVVEALWAAKEEPPAKLVGFSFIRTEEWWCAVIHFPFTCGGAQIGKYRLSMSGNGFAADGILMTLHED